MNLIRSIKEKIDELDNRFYLLIEGFVPRYIAYLKNPKNLEAAQEANFLNQSINKINSDAFILMNDMHTEIEKDSKLTASLTMRMEHLKKDNEKMKDKIKQLKRQSLTAEGMFDDQLDVYKDQLIVIIVMLIGVILGSFFLGTLKLDFKQWFISLAIVIVFGFLFTKLALWIVGLWQGAVGNKMDTIQ